MEHELMCKMQLRELPSPEPPANLLEFSPKPSVLYVADIPNWSFDFKGHIYRKHMHQFDVNIGYANEVCKTNEYADRFWLNMVEENHYDVVWHLQEYFIPSMDELARYAAKARNANTKFLLTVNQFYTVPHIKATKDRFLS